jgi:hypothetical protein
MYQKLLCFPKHPKNLEFCLPESNTLIATINPRKVHSWCMPLSKSIVSSTRPRLPLGFHTVCRALPPVYDFITFIYIHTKHNQKWRNKVQNIKLISDTFVATLKIHMPPKHFIKSFGTPAYYLSQAQKSNQ